MDENNNLVLETKINKENEDQQKLTQTSHLPQKFNYPFELLKLDAQEDCFIKGYN